MKKVCSLILVALILIGCSSKPSKTNFEIYNEIKDKLMNKTQFDTDYQFDIHLVYNKLDETYRYDIIMENPLHEMNDIKMIAYSNESDGEICPNIGLFDLEKFHLKKDYIDKEQGYYKGIHLSGITTDRMSIKVYVSYYTGNDENHRIEKYIEVFEDEIR